MEEALDEALAGALGIVASRLEGSRIRELDGLSRLYDGMRALEGVGVWGPDQGAAQERRVAMLLDWPPAAIKAAPAQRRVRWRRRPESNRCARICNPLRNHSATSPRRAS